MEAYKTFITSLKAVHESPDIYPKSSDVEVFVSSFFALLFRNEAGELYKRRGNGCGGRFTS